jgi:hypothetical protein
MVCDGATLMSTNANLVERNITLVPKRANLMSEGGVTLVPEGAPLVTDDTTLVPKAQI